MFFHRLISVRELPAIVCLLFGLVGCASMTEQSVAVGGNPSPADSKPFVPASVEADAVEGSAEDSVPKVTGTVFPGTGQFVMLPLEKSPIALQGDAVMLNFEQAPLGEVVHSILGETLGLDYVIEHPIKGEVTLRTRSPIPREQLLPILESLLNNNGVVMIRGPDDRYFVSGSSNARSTLPSFQSSPAGGGFSNLIIPLAYIGAQEMADILKPVAPPSAFVRVDARRNLLVLAGTQLQLEGWLGIISTFDIDQLRGVSVGVFPLENSAVDEVFVELEQILGGTSGEPVPGIADMVNIVPVERLNSILVISPRQHYINTVQRWIQALDSLKVEGSEPALHVYSVRNSNAMQLASLLSTIYSDSGAASPGGAGTKRQGVAPGLTQANTGGGATSSNRGANTGPGGGNFEFGDGIRVVADEYNNSLLVLATPIEYQRVEKTLIKLDVVATQVLIEASIVEVTLTDGLQYGLEWAFDDNLGGGDVGRGLLDFGGGLGAQVPGFSYTVADSAGAVKAVVNALAEKSLINVISTPSVMVLDNHTASIHVGDQQPIQSASTFTNGGNVQNSIQYKDTGVKLQVTPSVNDGGLVTLVIDQSITDVGSVDAATGQRTFLERNVSSTVAIRSGESLVLGGLIRDNETAGRSGIPLLMDIPVVGSLFSTRTTDTTRTELLIFISPRVVEGDQQLRDLNLEMRSRMKGITDFSDLPVNFSEGAASQ